VFETSNKSSKIWLKELIYISKVGD